MKIKVVKKHGSHHLSIFVMIKAPGSLLGSTVSGSWLRGVTRKEAATLMFSEQVFSLPTSQVVISWNKNIFRYSTEYR